MAASSIPPTPDDVPPQAALSALAFPVVGLGASAGGLEALLRVFEHMPAHTGMAFVTILHLSPAHESNAAAILQRATRMPVVQVTTDPTAIEADHVYVIPPAFDLLMEDGHLRLAPRPRQPGPHMAVDLFFRTLAHAHGARAMCVVLSGTGSDGAVGLTSIKENGGVALAQSPDDAAHDGMPRAAIDTGLVDMVLPAVDMAQRLVDIWGNAQRIILPDGDQTTPFGRSPPDAASVVQAEAALQDVMTLLHSYTQHDFRHYKRATVLRRIERRLQVNRLADLPAYRDFLHAHPEESAPLLQDMLISVTNFFRDRDAFEALERQVVPRMFEGKAPGEQVRAWVAGCASGEEAYSLSILLREQAEAHPGQVEVQIFATDIDERAIAIARKGIYPEGIVTDIAPSRMPQNFVPEQSQYRVAAPVREQVLFAVHNLLRDPPFSRLELICCRNLLIYLDRSAQAHVLEMFRVALKPGGYLFLGSSESADVVGSLFTAVDKKNRIYRVNPQAAVGGHLPFVTDKPMGRLFNAQPASTMRPRETRPSFAALHQQALEQFSPPSVLVDAHHNVLHLSNGVGRFLEHGSGEPSHNLLNNVRPEIRLELRTALFKAEQSGRSVETRLTQAESDGHKRFLTITVRPLQQADKVAPLTLVVFDEVEESMVGPEGDPPDAARLLLIGKMEDEIKQLKLHLQDTLEHSETSTEELKASNEELQAINEELRSATEELETSKEELQSMNEELVTLNFELKIKVEERGHINDDLQNLIASSEISTVFVDRTMRIKRYTPHASRLFNLIPSDLGRSLFDITSRLDYAELADDAESAFRTLRVIERKVGSTDGRHFFARILPYRTAEDKIEGAILNFFDVTELRQAEDRVRLAAATTRDYAIITTDKDGLIVTWNVGAERTFGYAAEEIVGKPFGTIFTPEDRERGAPEAELVQALKDGRAEDERWHMRKDGTRIYCSGVTSPLDPGTDAGFAKIARDMTGTKQLVLAQEDLLSKEKRASLSAQMANELKDKFLAVMSHELKQPLNLIQMNTELLTRLPGVGENPAVRRIGDTIKRAIGSQAKIINDLLDLSRIRTGKLRLNRVGVDLCEVARSLAQSAAGDAESKGIALEVQCDDTTLPCHCDPVRVEQIVWNMLSNALKFTPRGGRVTLALSREGENARLTVTDTGCGIASEFLPHVFGMFNQAHADTMPAGGGLGIGLALVQELTLAHGGRVEVASDGVGHGASFSAWLPMQDAPLEARPARLQADVNLQGWRVLAVDDYPDALLPFAEVLRLEGATVDTAVSGKEALEMLESHTYDLLVSDLGMPEMDGYQLIAAVRQRPETRKLMAIAMSGFGRRADARRALEAGFNAHLSKPAALDELKDILTRF